MNHVHGVDFSTLETFFDTATQLKPEKVAYSIYGAGQWNLLTYGKLREQVLEFADYLTQLGVRKNDYIAILSEAGLDWPVAFFGILRAGATVVPIDPKLTSKEIENILVHVEAKYLLVSPELAAVGKEAKQRVPCLQKLISLATWREGRLSAVSAYLQTIEPKSFSLADTAVISYTSGSEGSPKGVKLSHSTFLFQARRMIDTAEGYRPDVMFSILPLNHLFGLTCGLFGAMAFGAELCFPNTLMPRDLERCFTERLPNWMFTVPQLLQVVKQGVDRKLSEKGELARRIFGIFLVIASIFPFGWIKRLLFRELHRKFGGVMRNIVCGGAPLSSDLFKFYDRIGIPVCEGYGLTETGPILTFNTANVRRHGTVGMALTGVEIRIDKEDEAAKSGEILTRGPQLMQGYHKAEERTREVMTSDGWFRTGDIGHFDEDGFLRITGRAKSMIVLSNGKKVHPEEVEAVLANSALIQELCVVGLKRNAKDASSGEQIVAVIVPHQNLLDQHRDKFERIKPILVEEVERLCRDLAPFKHPTDVLVRKEPFEKTTSLKVKRKSLMDQLAK